MEGLLGASMMDRGDFHTPFIMMALLYALSTILFRRYFESRPLGIEVARAEA